MDQSREALLAARPHHAPERAIRCTVPKSRLRLPVVADYKRLSAVQAAGYAGRDKPRSCNMLE
jgi:hypothetical protein